jgi:hypothetical protein
MSYIYDIIKQFINSLAGLQDGVHIGYDKFFGRFGYNSKGRFFNSQTFSSVEEGWNAVISAIQKDQRFSSSDQTRLIEEIRSKRKRISAN